MMVKTSPQSQSVKAFVTKWEGVWNGEFWGQQAMGCRMRSWLCLSKLLMSLMG